MLVELASLKPNPLRDMAIDPLDLATVDRLTKSIQEHEFWGGVVGRKRPDGTVEVAAGWHRVNAAIQAGMISAEIFIADLDDAGMIRVYATENATQRGNSSTAVAGTVASAFRYIIKGLLTGRGCGEIFTTSHERATAEGNLREGRGIGRHSILRLLDKVPTINDYVVQAQLSNLRSSGDYTRIVNEVREEIEEEHKAALVELERRELEAARLRWEQEEAEARQREAEERKREAAVAAKAAKEDADRKRAAAEQEAAELERERAEALAKLAEKRRLESEEQLKQFDALRTTRDLSNEAAEAIANQPSNQRVFDFEGVARYLHTPNHITTFRGLVIGDGIKPFLPIEQQAPLAARLVAQAQENEEEVTSRYLREHIGAMVLAVRVEQRELKKEEERELQKKDWQRRNKALQQEFGQHVRALLRVASALADHEKVRPRGAFVTIEQSFRDAAEDLQKIVAVIKKFRLV